jgi:hypothetical protein
MKLIKTYKELFENYNDLIPFETTDYYNFIIDIISVVSPSMLKLAKSKNVFEKRYLKYDNTLLIINQDIEFKLIIVQANSYYTNQNKDLLIKFSEDILDSDKYTFYDIDTFKDYQIVVYKGFDYNKLFDVIEKYDITFIYNNEEIQSRKHFYAKEKSKKFNL